MKLMYKHTIFKASHNKDQYLNKCLQNPQKHKHLFFIPPKKKKKKSELKLRGSMLGKASSALKCIGLLEPRRKAQARA